MMANYMLTIVIDALPKRVFEFITDLKKIQEMNPHTREVKIISEQKMGIGTRTQFVMDTEKTGVVTWIEELVEWIPNQVYAFKTVGGEIEITGSRRLELMPDGHRTRLTATETVVGQPWDAKFKQDMAIMMQKQKAFIEQAK